MRRPAAILGVLCVCLTACGDDQEKTETVTVDRTVTDTPQGDTSGSKAPTETREATPTKTVRLGMFQSPSRNIGCALIGRAARCDIGRRSWSPRRPPGCPADSDFGQGLVVEQSGRGKVVCAGDTARDQRAPVLGYGTASRIGDLECVSRQPGVTCTNRRTGHGFLISAERYRLF